MQTASILTPALEALGKPEWADFFGSFLNNFSHMPPCKMLMLANPLRLKS